MKKIYFLGLALLCTTFSFAQDRTVGEEVNHWERMELSQDRSEDTLRPASYNDPCITNGFSLYSSTNGGYVNGMNGYGDTGAGQMVPLDGQADITGVLVWYGAKESVDGNTQITCSVLDKNGGNPQGSSTPHGVAAIDTTAGGAAGWYEYTLSTTVSVTDTFIVMCNWLLGSDTVGVVSTVDPCGGFAYETWSDASVNPVSASWGIDIDNAMLPMVDNLEYTGIFDTEAESFGVFQNGNTLNINGIATDAVIKTITIYDLSGRTVKEWPITDQWDNYSFDVSDINFGNYIIALRTTKGSFAQKFNLK